MRSGKRPHRSSSSSRDGGGSSSTTFPMRKIRKRLPAVTRWNKKDQRPSFSTPLSLLNSVHCHQRKHLSTFGKIRIHLFLCLYQFPRFFFVFLNNKKIETIRRSRLPSVCSLLLLRVFISILKKRKKGNFVFFFSKDELNHLQ